MFESPVDFYDSQTPGYPLRNIYPFESPVDFYDSQTDKHGCIFAIQV